MAIKEYTHGAGTDYQLWGNVGRFLVDIGVQKEMGNCISSEPGDVWWVSLTHKSQTTGFASARLMKNGHLYLRYFYKPQDSGLGLGAESLVKKALQYARDHGCDLVYTNWHKDSVLLEKLGFKPLPRERGNFCRWELAMEKEQ